MAYDIIPIHRSERIDGDRHSQKVANLLPGAMIN